MWAVDDGCGRLWAVVGGWSSGCRRSAAATTHLVEIVTKPRQAEKSDDLGNAKQFEELRKEGVRREVGRVEVEVRVRVRVEVWVRVEVEVRVRVRLRVRVRVRVRVWSSGVGFGFDIGSRWQ